MILYLIRHGQSSNNQLDEEFKAQPGSYSMDDYMVRRVAEPPLTAMGEEQAARLGTYLGGQPIERLFCSPMLRTMQTMQPVADALSRDPIVWIDLHEHGGIFERKGLNADAVGYPGLGRAQMAEKFPGFRLDGIGEGGWWYGGEEDREGCHARALRVLETLHRMAGELAEEDSIAAVSHGTFMDSLLKAIVGRLPGNEFYFNHHNTGITRVDFLPWGGRRVVAFVRYVNRTEHLADDDLTY